MSIKSYVAYYCVNRLYVPQIQPKFSIPPIGTLLGRIFHICVPDNKTPYALSCSLNFAINCIKGGQGYIPVVRDMYLSL